MRKRSMFLLVSVFGLLPFWISLAVLLAGVLKYGHSGEYAAAAGWYPLLGAGLSVYTLFVAILTVLVHGGTRGDAARQAQGLSHGVDPSHRAGRCGRPAPPQQFLATPRMPRLIRNHKT